MEQPMNLSSIDSPSFLLNIPTTFSSKVKNNFWMEEAKDEDLIVDKDVALAQWNDLYSTLSSNGLVTVLPTPYGTNLQDLVFVANLGIVIGTDTVIISNFTSTPRLGESEVGMNYFKLAGYKNVVMCPYKFEGEADLKHIVGNIYIGGYGVRSDIRAYQWMEQNFDMKIIKIKMGNPKLYHLDCSLFPITQEAILLDRTQYQKNEIDEMEKVVEIIHVPEKYASNGVTNSVRIHNFILNASDLYDLDPQLDKEDYRLERDKNQFLEDVCSDFGMEAVFINLSEYLKGGALLSCLVMHLNRFSYKIDLT